MNLGSARVYTEILRTPFSLTAPEDLDWSDLVAKQSVAHSESISSWLQHLEEIGAEFLGMTGGLRQGETEYGRCGEWWTVLVHDAHDSPEYVYHPGAR